MNADALSVYRAFARDINDIFHSNLAALYAYGSAIHGDLHIGYSDLDFLAVVSCDIAEDLYNALLEYRKVLKQSDNKLFGMLEGEFVPEHILPTRTGGSVAYWGTSNERMKNCFSLSGFSMRSLLDDGVLIYGREVRSAIPYPTNDEMLGQVANMIQTIRKHAVVTNEGIHSADWLFLICQSLYWLKTGKITCKTMAAEWAMEHYNSLWCQELEKAIYIRYSPGEAGCNKNRQWLAGLGESIQQACDTLELEFDTTPLPKIMQKSTS